MNASSSFNNSHLHIHIMIFLILMISAFDSAAMLQGEIRSPSLLIDKALNGLLFFKFY